MARMPGAIWKPLAANWASQPRMKAYDFFCIHTMVGTLAGTGTYFEKTNGPGYSGTESHFGVGPDGTIWQFQDTDFQADANLDGSWHVISSENADMGVPFPKWAGSDVPAMTPQQVESNARIAVFLFHTHGIPLGIAGSSKRGARGLAPHRYGVPGYMPAGAEQWSTSQGKACPGDRRIAQLPAISARAQQLLGGAPAPIPENDMPLNDGDYPTFKKMTAMTWQAVWDGGAPEDGHARDAFTWSVQRAVKPVLAEVQGQIAGLVEALKHAGSGQPIDLVAVTAAAKAGAEQALAQGVDVDVTVGGSKPTGT